MPVIIPSTTTVTLCQLTKDDKIFRVLQDVYCKYRNYDTPSVPALGSLYADSKVRILFPGQTEDAIGYYLPASFKQSMSVTIRGENTSRITLLVRGTFTLLLYSHIMAHSRTGVGEDELLTVIKSVQDVVADFEDTIYRISHAA